MLIIEAARKPEGLEAGVGVGSDIAEFIVVNPLNDRAGGCVNDQSRAAEVITDDAVCHTTLDHIVWDIGFATVDESRYHVTRTVELGDGIQLILVQEALG